MEIIVMCTSLVAFVLFGKKLRREWSSPIYLSGVFWIFYTLISYVFMHDSYLFSMLGIVWINVAFWIMIFAENFGAKCAKKGGYLVRNTFDLSNQSWLYLKVCCVLGLVAFLYQISLYGFNLSNFTSLDSLASMNNAVAVSRYSGNSTVNGLSQILLIFVYASPACGGFAFIYAEKATQKLWAAITMLPSVLMVLFTNTKAVLIGATIIWISTYLISYFLKHKHAPVIKLKHFLIVLVIFMVFFGFLFFSMILRMGEISSRTIGMAQRKLSIYAFGSVQSFDWWCANAYDADFKFGTSTYLGIANILGLAKKTQGVYSSFLGTSSNVFTAFRGIIEDFGFLLGILYLSTKAMMCGWCFDKLRCSERLPVFSVVFLMAEMFFLFFGAFVSPWTYMSYILTVVLFFGYLLVASGRNIRIVFGRKVLL
jgi:oligosaccharide repeat unit polymerase